ncbi:MAG: amino acid ABC transporter permease [Candidatus Parabeggiatoa sp. nov. 3]|nr:MAG: amino acid ABC transporter permease [Gammaproteobacteria bacterium]RKZ55768.1 MAG: amino acid ABC transporter permease [Gammaproteobacteria bacterium]RKZ80730.1 MAG: amino acid ABC transporter permease [Gammaproteobacteria bacterium]
MTTYKPSPNLSPPIASVGVLGWLQKNLFSSVFNTILTFFSLYLLYLIIPPIVQWGFINADWVGESRDACSSGGACWVFVNVRFSQFIYGFYPPEAYWRVNTAFILLALLVITLLIDHFPKKHWIGIFTLVGYPIIAFYLLYGGAFGLEVVETHRWGGLMLTLVLAVIGIVLSLPIGILLALGRRADNMPIVKSLCIFFIEFWRGVPLITVLFMASVMLPLFLAEGVNFDKLLRALIGIVLFESAYMAEVVRGGLQAIPKGQYEAAESLGLGYWQSTLLIILPQALKLVIPGIVNTFIALFKDTTLVLIIGLFDLLAVVQSAFADPEWLGYAVEGYVFVAVIYWLFCFSMSRYSQRLEDKLHTGHKRN